mmetsp:Transcript_11107/g.46176  ORF Transcript_11107/g.46176 Transcript_11107/m.46176 type:complete len:399 (-) Transcript_11107:121-1317(-)
MLLAEHVEGKVLALGAERLYRAVFLDGHREARRHEGRLAHPAREHAAGGPAVLRLRGEHAQRAHHAPHRALDVTHVCGRLPLREHLLAVLADAPLAHRLAHVSAALLAHLQVLVRGCELDADGVERQLVPAVSEATLQLIDGLARPAEGAEHAAGLLARRRIRQDCTQRLLDGGGHVAADRRAANGEGVALAHSGRHLGAAHELAIETLDAHAGLDGTARDGLRERRCVSIRRRVEHRHAAAQRVRRAPLRPLAVVAHELCQAGVHDRPVHRRDGHNLGGRGLALCAFAGRAEAEALQRSLGLPRGRREHAVEVVTPVLAELVERREAIVGGSVSRHMRTEELRAEQRPRLRLTHAHKVGPARRRSGVELQRPPAAEVQLVARLDALQDAQLERLRVQ